MSPRWRALGAGLAVLCLGAATPQVTATEPQQTAPASARESDAADSARTSTLAAAVRPLAGKVVVIDPGHQLGNATHQEEVDRLVDGGGFRKPCNSTGTQTDDGYPEATFNFAVARHVERALEAEGAQVHLTRTTNSGRLWGPCVDERGRRGNLEHADAVVSVHADGTAAGRRGFFVIQPALRVGWTDDVFDSSRTLGRDVHAGLRSVGLPVASFNGGDGYDVRGDLGTLNWSDVPVVMVELGNMRNPDDARQLSSPTWQQDVYAAGLVRGITAYLTRGSRARP